MAGIMKKATGIAKTIGMVTLTVTTGDDHGH
jgi:hypothetical protein